MTFPTKFTYRNANSKIDIFDFRGYSCRALPESDYVLYRCYYSEKIVYNFISTHVSIEVVRIGALDRKRVIM